MFPDFLNDVRCITRNDGDVDDVYINSSDGDYNDDGDDDDDDGDDDDKDDDNNDDDDKVYKIYATIYKLRALWSQNQPVSQTY